MLSSLNWLPWRATPVAACALLMLLKPMSLAHAAELTADEILERSKQAMSPPIRYRTISQGSTTEVCQKVLSDNKTAARVESHSPLSRIALHVSDKAYEFYPERGIGIDTSLLQESRINRAADVARSLEPTLATSRYVKDIVHEDGRECYEVVTGFLPDAFAALTKDLPKNIQQQVLARGPREKHEVIDKQTFLTVETWSVSNSGAISSPMEYCNIEHPADLPEDLFLPPDGIELLKPRDMQEYAAMLTGVLRAAHDQNETARPALVAAPTYASLTVSQMRRPQIDPLTGRLVPPMRTQMPLNSAQVLRRTKEAMKAPIRYRLVRDGNSTLVYQVELFAGGTATRLETSSPEARVTLHVGNDSCEYYPNIHRGIDTSSLPRSLVEQHVRENTTAPIFERLNEPALRAARLKTIALEGGQECFEITSNQSYAFPSAISGPRAENAQNAVASQWRILIDKRNFELIEMQFLTEAGSIMSHVEFRDIKHPADQYDLFLIPDGIEFSMPQSASEYSSLQSELLASRPANADASLGQPSSPTRAAGAARKPRMSVATVETRYSLANRAAQLQDRVALTMSETRSEGAEPLAATEARASRNGWQVTLLAVIALVPVCWVAVRQVRLRRAAFAKNRRSWRLTPTAKANTHLRKGVHSRA